MNKLNEARQSLEQAIHRLDLLQQQKDKQRDDLQSTVKKISQQKDRIALKKIELAKDYERVRRNQTTNDRRKAQKLSKDYSIPIIDDSCWEGSVYRFAHWVDKPSWLQDDPLKDGHYSSDWDSTLWLMEFYSKHHPNHPKFGSREFLDYNPNY